MSGRPVRKASTEVIRQLRATLPADFPIIGVGGIDSAAAALEKIEAGADLLQLYTGFIYRGPGLIREIAQALASADRDRNSK